MNLIKHRNWYFAISGIIIIPGIISLILFGLQLGIDFTGGSQFQLSKKVSTPNQQIQSIVQKDGVKVYSIQDSGSNTVLVRTEPVNQKTNVRVVQSLQNIDPTIQEKSFDTVGPTIGIETTKNAFIAVIIASIAIMGFIAFAFREVSKPLASWKYGVAAIAALLHDVLLVMGVFSIIGHFFGVEIDVLFITAVLTVMGFSVHDTIVVFDRIRENLKKELGLPYEEVVNISLLETFNRSLNTSLTVIIVLFTLLLFSGESIRWFVAALLIGILSGTYSSIFNASPILVAWNNWDQRRKNKKKK